MLHKCLKLFVFVTIFSSFSSISFAFCKYEYDYQSGNSYTICDNAGGTSLNGFNMNNGTTWSQQQNRDGTYNGLMGLETITLVIIILVITIILELVKRALGQDLLGPVIKILI